MKKPTKGARQLLGASAVLTLAGTVSLAGAPSAGAADNYLEFSADGNRYSPTLQGPLFDESVTYIPGTGQAATVWIRNNSADPARLSTAAVMVRSDPELNGYLGLAAGPNSSLSGRMVLGSSGSCLDVPATWNLGGGEEVALTFAVDMSLDAPNATRNREAEFDLLFYLESTEAGLGARPACDVLNGGTDGDGPGNSGPGGENGTVNGGSGTGGNKERPQAGGARSDAGGAAPAPGSLVALPGSSTSPGGPQAVPAGAVTDRPAVRTPNGTDSPGRTAEPQVLDARVQSTVEPVIRSLSGTLLIAMSVAFTAAVVLRVWSRRYV
ncbi:hypothetical protein NNX28_14320 [Arthrobacter sp. zg-Y859]|uniref:Cell surface protein n=1 Tax=Arthrobacter jinronghuae TaxID=2964609 RepID=A0ABT1NTR1_9MICC|nr:hypothetical protein [Arthrobacter jinronghuae]MCQ1951095.1 hypothetical protein [Arthrobacter jinronghuae]UWX79546.1 hypothetical protein N2K98_04920 [Arthrobacter jinronghuae]